jgi:hypothetical protein
MALAFSDLNRVLMLIRGDGVEWLTLIVAEKSFFTFSAMAERRVGISLERMNQKASKIGTSAKRIMRRDWDFMTSD